MGQVLIRNAYFSVDPYMRPRMNDVRSYVAPFTLGEAMTGGAVGRIAVSHSPAYAEGDWVVHSLGWREWALSDGAGLRKVDPRVAPVSTSIGVLGMPGFTAWYGLFVLGEPKEGETVLVSGAAGAVGSAASQMARIAGCRVVGSAGSDAKTAWLEELGFRQDVAAGALRRVAQPDQWCVADGTDEAVDDSVHRPSRRSPVRRLARCAHHTMRR